MTATLWHYTCDHGALALGEAGTLIPPLWQVESVPEGFPPLAYALLSLVWATDLDPPDRYALGLTRDTMAQRCDRMAYRYTVPARSFVRWGRIRSALPPGLSDALEQAPGAMPAHWFVAQGPVEGARRDSQYLRE